MHKWFYCLLLVLAVVGFTRHDPYRRIDNDSFTAGEELRYRVHYGFVNIGEGIVEVSPSLVKVNNRSCYQVSVYGRTSGAFDLGYKVRDTWQSYIDTSALIPQQFYMNIEENTYRKETTVFFDHLQKQLQSREKSQKTKQFTIPENVQDLISGYFFLRTIDFNKLPEGAIIHIDAFFDDQLYAVKVRYRGKGEVKTKFGKIKAIGLTPLMPANGLFKDENAIKVWISNDKNKIPVKVEADMFIGAIELELKNFKGLKQKLDFY
ncbi:DUF3108 domain-containing protein [Rhodocytophaga aerolata]|uniref:DUF3108 domain-containing protein n=1 Tax=Rhodocytophaga aerolata TaxID=455078 RepID=A0ABT8RHD3_9BACT|nr:DUF3108 domain-containing protein [Rhodocytophaga aerolata]MDO1451121.1 DUF3108 domain-containing protein [Rhodocytophaga aerolata]